MKRFNLSLSNQIILTLVLGVFVGLFFGELAGGLGIIGSAYIKLLQMTVIPYIVTSVIHQIGGLSLRDAKRIGVSGGLLLLAMLGLGIIIYSAAALAFPKVITASFFSAALVTPPQAPDFLDTYIPSNPFRSLSEGTIPAIVVFCILMGAALTQMEHKQSILDALAILSNATGRIASALAQLAPVGVFALTAAAVGTLTFEQISRLQVFLVCFYLATLLMLVWVLPGLAACVTPFKYRDIVETVQDACLLALTTGSGFVVLPMLSERIKRLYSRQIQEGQSDSWVDTLIPLSFSFPGIPSLVPILFVLFSAWFYGISLGLVRNLQLAVTGLVSSFGSGNVTVPFLLHQMHLPSDAFQLFVISSVFTRWGNAILGTMFTGVFTIICVALLTRRIQVQRRKWVTYLLTTVALTVFSVGAVRQWLAITTEGSYRGQDIITNMRVKDPVPARTYLVRPEGLEQRPALETGDLLEQISRRGVLRVGYDAPILPFAYFNSSGELVGYDVAMAHSLAKALGVGLEFVPIQYDTLAQDLRDGVFDIAMARIVIRPERVTTLAFSDPYLTLHIGFVVEDYREEEFKTVEEIRAIKNLRIAVVEGALDTPRIHDLFPDAQVVQLKHADEFFQAKRADALWTTAEEGSAWSMLYPTYKVVLPTPSIAQETLGYATATNNTELLHAVDLWLAVGKEDGTRQQLYDYWVLGKRADQPVSEWSIIRDVLHWIP